LNKTYIITHAVWVIFSGAVALEAWRLGFGSFVRPGPGFVPFLAGAVMGGLAVIALIQSILERSAAERVFDGRELRRVLLMIAALIVYVLLWNFLGFVVATFLLLLFLYRVVEPLRWRTVFIAAALTLTAVYLLFSTLLGARLPIGRLWTYYMN
jgi:putative tricarboxylic transport membrane protein